MSAPAPAEPKAPPKSSAMAPPLGPSNWETTPSITETITSQTQTDAPPAAPTAYGDYTEDPIGWEIDNEALFQQYQMHNHQLIFQYNTMIETIQALVANNKLLMNTNRAFAFTIDELQMHVGNLAQETQTLNKLADYVGDKVDQIAEDVASMKSLFYDAMEDENDEAQGVQDVQGANESDNVHDEKDEKDEKDGTQDAEDQPEATAATLTRNADDVPVAAPPRAAVIKGLTSHLTAAMPPTPRRPWRTHAPGSQTPALLANLSEARRPFRLVALNAIDPTVAATADPIATGVNKGNTDDMANAIAVAKDTADANVE